MAAEHFVVLSLLRESFPLLFIRRDLDGIGVGYFFKVTLKLLIAKEK